MPHFIYNLCSLTEPYKIINLTMASREKWAEIIQLFQCLWNPQDPNFSNEVMRKASWKLALRLCNETSKVPVDMETLRVWVITNVDVLKYKSAEHIPNPPQHNKITTQKPRNTEDEDVPNLMHLALEFPCLWDYKDPNHKNYSMRERCKRQLLAKCNAQTDKASIITMEMLSRQLATLCGALRKHPKLLEAVKRKRSELAASQVDTSRHFQDVSLSKTHSQVQVAHVAVASGDLQSVVRPPGTSIHQRPIKLNDIENEIKAQRNGDETSSSLSEMDSSETLSIPSGCENSPHSPMELEENETRDQASTNEANESDSKTPLPSLLALVDEFPCLWDQEHPLYGDVSANSAALQAVLWRYNGAARSHRLSMRKLRRRMRAIVKWKQRPKNKKKADASDRQIANPEKSKDKNELQQNKKKKQSKQKVKNNVVLRRGRSQYQNKKKEDVSDRQITDPEKSKDKKYNNRLQQNKKKKQSKQKVKNDVPFEISSDSDEPLSNYKVKRARKETTVTTEIKAPNTGNKIPNINITHFARNEVTLPHIVISVPQSNVFDPNKVLFVPRSEFPDPTKPLSIPNIRITNTSTGNAVPNTELAAPNTGNTGSDSIVAPRTEIGVPTTGTTVPNTGITVPNILISSLNGGITLPNTDTSIPNTPVFTQPTLRNTGITPVPDTRTSAPAKGSSVANTEIIVPNTGITVPNILISSLNGGITLPNTDTSIPNTPVFTQPTLRNTGITPVPDTRTSVPSKGTSVPSKGTSVPSKGTSVPSKGTSVPCKGTSVPSKGTSVPSKGTSIPSKGTSVANTETIVPNAGITVSYPTITVSNTKRNRKRKRIVPVFVTAVRDAVTSPDRVWCTFCGELKSDCTVLTENERPYLTKQCVDLHIADLWLVVLHADHKPAHVCGECDRKLRELHDFVRRAKVIQEKLKFVQPKRIIGEIENTNTTDESRGKTFKITIDLDSDTISHMSDDDCVEINHSDEIETAETEISEVNCKETDPLTVDTEVAKENFDVIDMTYSDDDIETKPNIEVLASSSDTLSTKVSESTKTASVDVSQPLTENGNVINIKVEESPSLTDIELSNQVLEEKYVRPVNIDPMLVNSADVNNEECDPRDDIPNLPRLADHDEHDLATDTNIVSEINERKPNVSVSISSSDIVNSYNINDKESIVTDEASISSDKLSNEVLEKSVFNSHTIVKYNDAVSKYKKLLLNSLSLDSGNKLVDIKPLSLPCDDVDSIIASKLHLLEAKYEKIMKDKRIASANVQSHTSPSKNYNDGNNDSESKHSLFAESGDVKSHLAPSNGDEKDDESHGDKADNETDTYETFLKAVLLQAINSAGVDSSKANNGTNVGNVMVDVKKEIDEDTEMEVVDSSKANNGTNVGNVMVDVKKEIDEDTEMEVVDSSKANNGTNVGNVMVDVKKEIDEDTEMEV